ncbi:MAG: sensor histidine kinase [Anaerolineales bacterium]
MTTAASSDAQRLAAVLRSVTEAIIATDPAGAITLLNPSAEKVFALAEADVVGQPVRTGLNPALGTWLERAIEEGRNQPLVFEWTLGLDNHFAVSLAPIFNNRHKLDGWVIVLQDVTHLKKIEHWRSEAVQTAAHDLRNPLNLMYGAVNLLRDTLPDLTPEQQSCLDMLTTGMERMGALIEQLLNLEQVDAGMDITLSKLTLRRVIEKVVEEHRLSAEAKGVQLDFEGLPATGKVLGDESWLHRAVANLMSNALKYTPRGGRVTVRYREADGQGVCEVTDTGLGIPVAAQTRLFERFYRVRSEATRGTPGSGLGLAIVKRIIEKHSGRVWVSSEEGKGSTFGFSVALLK